VVLAHLILFMVIKSGMVLRLARSGPDTLSIVLIAPVNRSAGGQAAQPVPMPTPLAPQPRFVPPLPSIQMSDAPHVAVAPTTPPAQDSDAGGAGHGKLGEGAGNGAGNLGEQFPTIASSVEYLRKPTLEYPPKSRREREEGEAVMRVLVSDAGLPLRAEVERSSGSPRLDEAARQAVLGALFKPYIENGKPLTVYVLVPINFKLSRA